MDCLKCVNYHNCMVGTSKSDSCGLFTVMTSVDKTAGIAFENYAGLDPIGDSKEMSKPALNHDIIADRNKQVGGDHYKKYSVQPWDIIVIYDLDYWEGTALKYLLRRKGDKRKEDIEKCIHVLQQKLHLLSQKDKA